MRVATFYEVVSVSKTTFWTIWGHSITICDGGDEFWGRKEGK